MKSNLAAKTERYGRLLKAHGSRPLVDRCVHELVTRRTIPDRVPNRPLRAQVEVTNVCNLKCRMCAQVSDEWTGKTRKRMLTMDEFRLITGEIGTLWHILINGIGEPLLNSRLIDMIDHAGRQGIRTSFYTNGMLMTPDVSKELVRLDGLKEVIVSIDTGISDDFSVLRAGADLETIFSNMRAFLSAPKKNMHSTPTLAVSMTIMPEYIRGIPPLIEELKKLGIMRLEIKDAHNVKNALDAERVGKAGSARILEYQAEYSRAGFGITYLHAADVNKTATRTCIEPWHMIYISVNGDIHPCCYSYLYPETVFGNIFRDSPGETWNSGAFMKFRRDLREGMPRCCSDCPAHSRSWLVPEAPRGNDTPVPGRQHEG